MRAKIHLNENMEEHRRYKIRCAVVGSKPAPVIDWYINDKKIEVSHEIIQKEEKTVSLLNYVAESEHNGLNITCKAYNQQMRYDYVQDTVPINVHCKPYRNS